MREVICLLSFLFLSSCSIASEGEIKIPASDSQRLIPGNLDWYIESFMGAYCVASAEWLKCIL